MSDDESKLRCPVCRAPLVEDASGRACPRCALAAALADPVDEAEATTAGEGLFAVPGYAVLAELGRGASGLVYRVRQEQPKREVALKILRPHEAVSAEMRARFRLEAATVAALDHPGILPLLSVGECDGLPYYTMKLCQGSLAERLDRYRGRWRECATLLAGLADAVQHAHSRGVLHRDLKPGNVLFDEADRPFVSDFGLAKSLAESGGAAPVTRPLLVMGTPGYLAPEVLTGGAGAATIAADIYALGAILHELLTGSPPSATEAERAPRPGVPRDLAVICGHSLQAEPGKRYLSAQAFAEDLRAWLAGRPIAARPVSALGQVWAWAKRNPALSGVSLAAVLLLGVVAVVASFAAVRLGREQRATAAALDRATTESATSQAIADFLRDDLLAQAAPENQPDRDLKLRTVLDRAAEKISGRFAAQPAVEAAIRGTLADTYASLGEFESMRVQVEREIALDTRLLGAEDPATLRWSARLAGALLQLGKLHEAESLSRAVLAKQRRLLGPEHPDVLTTMGTLERSCTALGLLGEARQCNEQMYETSRRVLGLKHPTTQLAMLDLAARDCEEGRLAEAETLSRQLLDLRRQTFGAEHPLTLSAMRGLASLFLAQQKPGEAERIDRQVLEIRQRILGVDHLETLNSMGDLLLDLKVQGKFAEAQVLGQQILAARIRRHGPEHPYTLLAMDLLADVDLNLAQYDEAEALFLRSLEIRRRLFGPEQPPTLLLENNLALAYETQGKLAEAEALDVQALAGYTHTLGLEHPDTLIAMGSLAVVLQEEGKYAEAEPLFAKRLEISRRALGATHSGTLRALDRLGAFLLLQGRFGEAEPLLREALQSRTALHPHDWPTEFTRSLLGGALAGQGHDAEAEPLLVDSYTELARQFAKIPAFRRDDFQAAGDRLVEFYSRRGKTAEADGWRRKIADAATARGAK